MQFPVSVLQPDITYKTSRSGGKGGQHVNKVSSKVELNYNFQNSVLFTEEQKMQLREKLRNRLNADGNIQIICEEGRSQLSNKNRCLEKLVLMLQQALHKQKQRKATKPKHSAIEQRLKEKQLRAMKKINRRKDFY